MGKPTPGPWVWSLNKKTHHITLTGKFGWGHTVMDFVRYGMNSAAPRFNVDDLMYRADALASVIAGEEHHVDWNMDINHPDANLIAAAPDLLQVLKRIIKGDFLKPCDTPECDGEPDGKMKSYVCLGCLMSNEIKKAISKAEGGA